MTIPYAVRSLRTSLLALLIIGSLTTACKKSGGVDGVDPRDQYVGVYDGGYQASTLVNNSLESNRESGTVKITVSKAQAMNQLYLELFFNNATKQNVTAELSEKTFTVIDKQTESLVFDGKTYANAKYTATGQFIDKTIVMNTTTETLQSGVTLSRQGSITGTMK
ncbi:hypothetical protein [Spirosoma spitsbergense]|jgi:hypothetical protein|uniref:hypothetical protein n=1 Tax=Spirosoma spitsbergense TaxID=431554 RepID=UPI00037C881C|nr:hypothetical protein [Spirosoma spitsbergense]